MKKFPVVAVGISGKLALPRIFLRSDPDASDGRGDCYVGYGGRPDCLGVENIVKDCGRIQSTGPLSDVAEGRRYENGNSFGGKS